MLESLGPDCIVWPDCIVSGFLIWFSTLQNICKSCFQYFPYEYLKTEKKKKDEDIFIIINKK